MINNWFFSNNADVIGPLTLSAAKLHVTENPNAYGWHPTFTQWKPVSCIDEFSRILPPVVQDSTFQKEISAQFIAKQKRIENRLMTVGSGINNTELSLESFHEKISQYNLLTQNLSIDVKDAINNIENKYANLKRHLSQVKEAVNIASNETLTVIKDFNRRVIANDVSMPLTSHNTPQKKNENQKITVAITTEQPEVSQEKLPEAYQPIKAAYQEELESKYLESRHLESKYNVSDYLKLSKKINVPNEAESQQFYRGVPVDTPEKPEATKHKFEPQKMYRGVPILAS